MTVHLTEEELARDVRGALEKVRHGTDVIIEEDSHPVAVIQQPLVKGRMISEVIADMEASGANAVIDDEFGRDVEEGTRPFREPWNPPSRD